MEKEATVRNKLGMSQGLESWNSLGTHWNLLAILAIFGTFLHRSSRIPDLGMSLTKFWRNNHFKFFKNKQKPESEK
jgi:hypothetical protein